MYLRFPVTKLHECSVISPDPDAPELPPPLEPDSQDTSDIPPVYQDIKLSCKPVNKLTVKIMNSAVIKKYVT